MAKTQRTAEQWYIHFKKLGWVHVIFGILFAVLVPFAANKIAQIMFVTMEHIPAYKEYYMHEDDRQLVWWSCLTTAWISSILSALLHAVTSVFCGLYFFRMIHWRTCMLFSFAVILFFPLGTILGGFSVYALMHPDVRLLFKKTKKTNI